MQLRFTTSIATTRGYFHEGRVLTVDKVTGDLKEWLRAGILVPVRSTADEVAVAPELEQAVTRRGRASRTRADGD